jgi:hypothetical protein
LFRISAIPEKICKPNMCGTGGSIRRAEPEEVSGEHIVRGRSQREELESGTGGAELAREDRERSQGEDPENGAGERSQREELERGAKEQSWRRDVFIVILICGHDAPCNRDNG